MTNNDDDDYNHIRRNIMEYGEEESSSSPTTTRADGKNAIVPQDTKDSENEDYQPEGDDDDQYEMDEDGKSLVASPFHQIIKSKKNSSSFSHKERERERSFSRSSTPPPLEIPKPDGTERGQFLHDLYTFMQKIGQPITKIPQLGYRELDLYRLYQLVIKRGGMDEVTRRQEWKTVYQELGIPTMSTSASYNTRTNYKKHLYLYELEYCDFNERRPIGMEPKFNIGEFVRIVSSNYEGQVFYAKVAKFRWRNGRNMYYVHYNGWSNSHDEWMPEGVLSKLLEEEERAGHPERLTNPHPNRSSKSNHIIGDPAPHSDGRERMKSIIKSKYGRSESEEEILLEHYYRSLKKGGAAAAETSPDSHSRRLRLKLKSRDKVALLESKASSTSLYSPSGPTLSTVRAEMEKLDAEKFLDYLPPSKVKFLNYNNLHTFSPVKFVAGFKKELLKTVDLRVPNLEDIVGQPPITSLLTKANNDDHDHDHDNDNDGKNDSLDEKKSLKASHENNSVTAIETELRAIRKEYRKKKRLLQFYYGGNGGGGDISSSSIGGGGTRSSPETTQRRARRMRS